MLLWLARSWRRLQGLLSRTHDRQLRDELQLHLDLLAEEYLAQGLTSAEARSRAQREFGNPMRIQETSHDLFTFGALEQLVKDLSCAAREIKRSPAFTAVAVLSLAVGIGAVTTASSVIDAMLFRGLSVHEPERLVAFSRGSVNTWARWPYGAFRQWADAPDAPFDVAAVYTLSDLEQPLLPATDAQPRERLRVSLVSGSYFDVLGAPLAKGRGITPADDQSPSGNAVVVISHAFWVRHFGRAEDVLGRAIELNEVSYEVVGVAADGFIGEWIGNPADVWLPLTRHGAVTRSRATLLREDSTVQWLRIAGRLHDGTSAAQATAAANLLRQRTLDGQLANPSHGGMSTEPVVLLSAKTGYAPLRQQYTRPMMVIAAVVGIVLVVACANFSNLLYGRSRSRQQEYAVRLALGAGRWRIVRQSLVECMLLAGVAAALGVGGAAWATTGALKHFAVTLQPLDVDLRLDTRVLSVTVGCTVLVIFFGLVSSVRWLRSPALHLSQAFVHEQRRNLVGRLFLVGQFALCFVLLFGTGLMLRTIDELRTQELGVDRNVLLVTVAPAQAGYSQEAAAILLQRIREQLLAIRGIRSVSATGATLMDSRAYWVDGSERLAVGGRSPVSGGRWTSASVGAAYFATVGLPLIQGRDFAEADLAGPSDAVVINQSMSTLLFGTDNALGQRIDLTATGTTLSVIGVVNDARQTSPRDRGLPVLYRPLARIPAQVALVVRTQDDGAASVDVVRHQLLGVDRNLPIIGVQTIDEVLERAIGQERLLGTLAAWLGVLVIGISCVGLYALISNDVGERTQELGVRVALGATRTGIATLVLRDCAKLAALALAAGVPLAIVAVRPLRSQLYGVEPDDPATVMLVILLLSSVALVAAARPALAAARVDPLALLRSD